MSRRRNTSSMLRHRLTLQKEVQAPDGAGGYVRSWQDVVDLWAEVIPLKGKEGGREIFLAARLQSTVTHRIIIRYRQGVNASQRLLFENRAFHIRHVSDTGSSSEMLELFAEEGVL